MPGTVEVLERENNVKLNEMAYNYRPNYRYRAGQQIGHKFTDITEPLKTWSCDINTVFLIPNSNS